MIALHNRRNAWIGDDIARIGHDAAMAGCGYAKNADPAMIQGAACVRRRRAIAFRAQLLFDCTGMTASAAAFETAAMDRRMPSALIPRQEPRMSIVHPLSRLALSLLVPIALAMPAQAKQPATRAPATTQTQSAASLNFNGARYLHRWSDSTQAEFTPAGQEDLSKWQDMITVVTNAGARDGEQLAGLAEAVLARYKQAGKIIKTDSKPRTPQSPAEHLIVAVLPGKGFVETVFARIKLIDDTGTIAIYAHRVYGENAANDFGAWLTANGEATERAVMAWDGIPTPAQLSALPRSK